jgi:hypothetical protein
MKELQEVFIGKGQVKGFMFTLVKKTEFAYLYKVDTGDSVHYEIFERKENTKYNCISYPSDKAFGVWAKTTPKYEDALDILEMFDNKVIVRNKILG